MSAPAAVRYDVLQDAIDAAAAGDTIQVGTGTYQEDLRILKTLTLLGEGKDVVTLEGSVSVLGGIAVTLQGFTIKKGNGIEACRGAVLTLEDNDLTESGADGLLLSNASALVRGTTIRNAQGNGILATQGAELTLSQSTISSNSRVGILLTLGSSASITDSTIEKNSGDGSSISASVADIRDNIIVENEGCGIRAEDGAVLTGGNNGGWGGRRGALCDDVPVAVAPAVRDARELIQAVGALEDGTIVITAGTYDVNLFIRKSLNLVGIAQERTIIKGLRSDPVLTIGSDTPIEVRIENLTITGARWGFPGLNIDIGDQVKVSLTDSTVSSNEGFGIAMRGGSPMVSLIDSTVIGNRLDGLSNNVGLLRGGIGSPTVSLINSIVSGNGQSGLEMGGSATVSLIDSTVASNGGTGLVALEEARVEVRSSTIIESNGNGLTVMEQARATVIDSTIRNNTNWGVAAVLKECGFSDDAVQLYGFTGQVVFEGTNKIEGNNTSGNQDGMGNPGEHPFKDLPDGQVCLP